MAVNECGVDAKEEMVHIMCHVWRLAMKGEWATWLSPRN